MNKNDSMMASTRLNPNVSQSGIPVPPVHSLGNSHFVIGLAPDQLRLAILVR